ncbi:MAG: hypothetical protein EA376_07435 [Phycisphaeraceae bacterium]|nr:MAG: hypothetical protein EA376_07435 [Phycisphaeraceae bacterium]
MNTSQFFQHWGIAENPFRAEEARQDSVFHRLDAQDATHPDFEKILGDLHGASTSILFGEKGSGKTAIRIQIERRIARHNRDQSVRRLLLIPYDDLNPILDGFVASLEEHPPAGERRRRRREQDSDQTDPDLSLQALRRLRLVDHMDGILHVATAMLVDALLGDVEARAQLGIDDETVRSLRKADRSARRELMILQACYDRAEHAAERASSLRRRIRAPRAKDVIAWELMAWFGWILPMGVIAIWLWLGESQPEFPWMEVFFGALAVWGLLMAKRVLVDPWRMRRIASKIHRGVRVVKRSTGVTARLLAALPASDREASIYPVDDSDDSRYAMFTRLLRAGAPMGFVGAIVVFDRVDEPTLVSGHPERMQAVVWPMLNNKFLQMEGVGFKLLLPLELRHSLLRESTVFFQEARLDKQNYIERLSWTGATLYDLCNARLIACQNPAAEPISLIDLFEEDVSRQDLVESLEHMRQPRDAFKFLYQCIQQHCSSFTQEEPKWRIPRHVLEVVRRSQSDRIEQLYRGVRPA